MSRKKEFIMSPKIDVAFKLIFGQESTKKTLVHFLAAVLKWSKEDFIGIELKNVEITPRYAGDKKGILDVLVQLKDKSYVNIEIQVAAHQHMAHRSLLYWSRMYARQIESGDDYAVLKKCIAINVVNFECTPEDRSHTIYHITEKTSGRVWENFDVLEIHFLEMRKIELGNDDPSDPIIEWLKFIRSESKEEMELLAKNNSEIKKAYDTLYRVSQDPMQQLIYEAREKELLDQNTIAREKLEEGLKIGEERGRKEGKKEGMKIGEKKGREEGKKESIEKIVKSMIYAQLDVEKIAEISNISIEEINEIKKMMNK